MSIKKLFPVEIKWNVKGKGAPAHAYEFRGLSRKRWIGTKESVADYSDKQKKLMLAKTKKIAVNDAVFNAHFLANSPNDYEYRVIVRNPGGSWIEAECILFVDDKPSLVRTIDEIDNASVHWAEIHDQRNADDADGEEEELIIER